MNIKVRLALMNFLEFAVWGAYLTSMSNYLGHAGMGAEVKWFLSPVSGRRYDSSVLPWHDSSQS